MKLTVRIDTLFMAILIAFTIYGAKFPYTPVPVYYVLLPLCVIYAFTKIKQGRFGEYFSKNTKRTTLCWMLIAVYAVLLIPFTANNGINIETIYYLFCLGIVSYAYCHYMINNPNGKRNALKWFFIISVLIALFGWYEAFTGNIVNLTSGSYYYRKNFLGLTSPNTIFFNINDHAVFMSFAFIIGMIYTEQTTHKRLVQILCWVLFVTNIVLVDSRGAELFVIVFCGVYMLISRKWRKSILVVGVVAIAVLMISPAIMDISLLSAGITDSGRSAIWNNVFIGIKNSHYMGVGAGNSANVNHLLNSNIISNVHSFFFEIFEDYGIIGFTLSIIWYVGAVIDSFTLSHVNKEMKYVFAGLLGFFPLSIVSSSLVGKTCLISFIAIITAVINCHQIIYRYERLRKNEKNTGATDNWRAEYRRTGDSCNE